MAGRNWNSTKRSFLDASTHLYKTVCPSVGPSVGPSIGWLVRNHFFHRANLGKRSMVINPILCQPLPFPLPLPPLQSEALQDGRLGGGEGSEWGGGGGGRGGRIVVGTNLFVCWKKSLMKGIFLFKQHVSSKNCYGFFSTLEGTVISNGPLFIPLSPATEFHDPNSMVSSPMRLKV